MNTFVIVKGAVCSHIKSNIAVVVAAAASAAAARTATGAIVLGLSH